ncbi:AAA family ATPase [Asanoa sp. NPDC050611]|uniref:AAA family ATPase n=1 Tax=Asanoa sp. NPDC050611 TaxID=3157098 RepID=UPI0034086C05
MSSTPATSYLPPVGHELLNQLVEAVRSGRGDALVVSGEAGIGKSALLRRSLDHVPNLRTLWVNGVEFEMEFAFAALEQLSRPVQDRIGELTVRHRAALEAAFGWQAEGGQADKFAAAAAFLELLSTVAGDEPVICVVDDAQWLDRASAQALAFAARRIGSDPVGIVFAVRDPQAVPEVKGLRQLVLTGLDDQSARQLLTSTLPVPLDERVRERILREARGNPLALLELPTRLGPSGLAGGFGLPTPTSPANRIEHLYRERLGRLSASARTLLLLAAAEPLGDVNLLWRAADHLGVAPDAAEQAEADGLIELGAHVRFRHPLVRSAVYRSATPPERRRAHGALAEATDSLAEPDRRAWHLAQAAARPDEHVAAGLLRSAERARQRGGAAAEAAFLEQAAMLTPDSAHRAGRMLQAARAKLDAGAFEAASGLIESADADALPEPLSVQASLLRAQAAFFQRGAAEAVDHLLHAAERDPARARLHLLDALQAGMVVSRTAPGTQRALAAARQAPPAPAAPSRADQLLDSLVSYLDGDLRTVPTLKRILADVTDPLWARRLSLAALLAVELWDFDLEQRLARHAETTARADGSLVILPVSLWMLAMGSALRGDLPAAVSSLSEADDIASITGVPVHWYAHLQVAALRGRRAEAEALITQVAAEAGQRDKGLLTSIAQYSRAVLANGIAEHRTALDAARLALRDGDLAMTALALPELVEAAVRSGEHAIARQGYERLSEHTEAAGTDWALGVRALMGALLSTEPEGLYREAVDRLAASGTRIGLARAHLNHGVWLRREGRRAAAREALRTAYEHFIEVGADGFAQRARLELAATGERARTPARSAVDALTPQELTIARLAATGATTREVADRLFLSPRTIDAHLRGVFRKLEITSRRQLRGALNTSPAEA